LGFCPISIYAIKIPENMVNDELVEVINAHITKSHPFNLKIMVGIWGNLHSNIHRILEDLSPSYIWIHEGDLKKEKILKK